VKHVTAWRVGLLVAGSVLVVAGAHAHLVYVAVTSQPDCLAHVRPTETGAPDGQYRAAKSACTPPQGAPLQGKTRS
jgi:hypothetical protein